MSDGGRSALPHGRRARSPARFVSGALTGRLRSEGLRSEPSALPALLFLLLWPVAAFAQDGHAPCRDIALGYPIKVVAGAGYSAGAVQRFLFGTGWRALWTTPIQVPVLDLKRTAGGLRPLGRGGGFQTRSLELAGADGREFRFRSVDKDPSQKLPAGVRWPGIVSLVRDETSALHPASALVAASLAETAGIPHLIPRLVVMPNDPALGAFRAEFAGMLGLLEERPAPGVDRKPDRFGFRDVLATDSLLPRLGPGWPGRVDAREYLAARLLDFYLNDWDRHEGNWLWGTRDSVAPYRWLAIPKDRDQALAWYDGLAVAVVRMFVPKLVPFTDDYRLGGLTVNSRALDASILRGLPAPVWDSVAAALVARLSDSAIERALRTMPDPYYRLSAAELTEKLRKRRGKLPEAARVWAGMLTPGG
jgi:hypothetical protein